MKTTKQPRGVPFFSSNSFVSFVIFVANRSGGPALGCGPARATSHNPPPLGARRRPHPPRAPRGFTLIEILLTLLILSLLLTSIYLVLLGTIRAVERVEYISQRSEIGPSILQIVARDFEHAVMPGGRPGGAFHGIDQSYGSFSLDRVDFVSNVPALGVADGLAGNPDEPPRPSPLNEVGYRLDANPYAPGLFKLFRREDYFVDGEPLRGGTLVEVYDRVRSFSVEYFDGRRWVQRWDSGERGGLPVAVRLGLDVEVGTPDAAKQIEDAGQSNVGVQSYQIIVTLPR